MRRFLGSAARLRLFAILTAIAALAAVGLASSASAGTGAQLTISPTSKNFGTVVVGSSNGPFTFTVKNTGTVQTSGLLQVSVTGANAAEFSPAGGSCTPTNTVVLPPGGTCTVTITFTPGATASGNRNANLKVSATPGGGPSAALSGTALNAVLAISPTSHNYGSVGVGSSSGLFTFTVTNTGSAVSGTVTDSITGGNADQFHIFGPSDSCVTTTVGTGGDSCEIKVSFDPTSGGNKNATLNVTASPGGTLHVPLSGTGMAAQLSISPSSWNFGSSPVGTPVGPKTFTVTNIGAATSGVVTFSTGGGNAADFVAVTGATDGCLSGTTTLIPNDSCTIDVTFNPSAGGNRNTNLNASASPGGNVHASLSGTGTTAHLSISPTGWNFDSVAVNGGIGGSQTFTVTNDGTTTSGAVTFSTGGGNAADFVAATGATDGCVSGTTALLVNDSCTIDVTFNPSAGGNRNANLNVSASPGGNVSAALTGTGTIAKLTISPGNHNFGNSPAGTPVGPFTFTVTNSGTDTSAAVTFSVSGTNSSEFSAVTGATNGCISATTTLAPGASCTIDVTWNSTAPTGDKKARLDVSAGTGEGTPHADLSGKTI